MSIITADHIRAAQKNISGIAHQTPLIRSPYLSERAGFEVLLKLESMQPIGAFKLRGAANALLNLPKGVSGVACCSTGNHGRGIAYAAKKLGLRAVICMSKHVPQVKIDGIRALGGDVRIVGQSYEEAQAEVDRLVISDALVDVSPFDDPHVIAGQGTIGLELMAARPDITTILTPLSGGGLAGGIALAAKDIKPDLRIIGVTMEHGAAMHASIRAHHPVDVTEAGSLADSLGGGINNNNTFTLDLCSRLLDDTVLVSETEIYRAMQTLYFQDRLIAEGASATTVAGLQSGRLNGLSGPVAIIISGRNVDMTMFTDIMNGRDIRLGETKIKGQPYQLAGQSGAPV